MGPTILIDKSTLQSLSNEEIWCLSRHYFVIYTPILFTEILGDLTKDPDNEESKRIVAHISDKIKPGDSCFTTYYRILLANDLQGNLVPMDGRPIRIDAIPVLDFVLGNSLYFQEQPERETLRRWIRGEFTPTEQQLSEIWRTSTQAIDVEDLRQRGDFSAVDSVDQLMSITLEFCDDPNRQLENLHFLLEETTLSSLATPIFEEWLNQKVPQLKEFAPFAYYCLTVIVAFYTAIANHLGVGEGKTNRVDLEYLLYLPFCQIFVSNDEKFHKKFAPLFLTDQQDFVEGSELKQDLKRIQSYWNSLSETEQEEYKNKWGPYPPDWDDSITNQLWKKYMLPRSEYESSELTPEREKELLEQFLPIIESVERRRNPDA